MTHFLAYLNGGIMLILSALHFYWAAGGRLGLELSAPSDAAGNRVLQTGIMTCIAVGTGLLGFSFYYQVKSTI